MSAAAGGGGEGRMSGKVALVTGAGSGIGRAIAVELAREGADVVVSDAYPDESEAGGGGVGASDPTEVTAALVREASAGRGWRALVIYADVADREAVEALVEEGAAGMGRIDVCVSCASYAQRENFLEMDWEVVQRTFEVTQFGAMHLCHFAARKMVEQGPRPADGRGTYKLLLISSVMADLPHLIPSTFAYNVSKGSLDTLTKSLASGLAQHSITVNCIQPGWIDSPLERGHTSAEDMKMMARHLPFGIGKPLDVAKGAIFLCSADADYITGSTLKIDGGFSVAQRIPHLHEPIICARRPVHNVDDDGDGGGDDDGR
jgi:glucose 1-dehydrogenase